MMENACFTHVRRMNLLIQLSNMNVVCSFSVHLDDN